MYWPADAQMFGVWAIAASILIGSILIARAIRDRDRRG